jgi:triosephosphate isomerase (TIM)
MASAPRPLVAGNWKMNGLRASRAELEKIIQGAKASPVACDLLVCPPVTLLENFAAAVQGAPVSIGAQDCHAQASGAFTGDISAEMLKDAGASAVIVGHSERRMYHKESDVDVRAKAAAAARADSLDDQQLIIAYEPVWAIGTGLTPTAKDVAEVHGFIRERLTRGNARTGPLIRILYGGSVKPTNARELMAVPDVNGALVGGASLKAEEFLGIAAAYR